MGINIPNNLEIYAVTFLVLILGTIEFSLNLYGKHSKRSKDDWLVELMSTFQLFVIIKPLIFPLIAIIIANFFTNSTHILSKTQFWSSLLIIIIVDDILHYWYHRKSHEWNWLWKLHRPHHTAKEMGVLVSYRNATLFYILMPNIWWLGASTYLGFHNQVVIAIILKQIIVTAAHSEIRWDRFLYSYKLLNPIAWIIERCISTPSTHFSHHGQSINDGISNPNGNFSNMFFIWDIIFGTALITRMYPKKFGIENDPKDNWTSQLFYPIIKSKKMDSELSN